MRRRRNGWRYWVKWALAPFAGLLLMALLGLVIGLPVYGLSRLRIPDAWNAWLFGAVMLAGVAMILWQLTCLGKFLLDAIRPERLRKEQPMEPSERKLDTRRAAAIAVLEGAQDEAVS